MEIKWSVAEKFAKIIIMINCLLALEYIFGFISDQCSYFPFNLFALKITGVAVSYFNIPARNSIVEFSNPMHIRHLSSRHNAFESDMLVQRNETQCPDADDVYSSPKKPESDSASKRIFILIIIPACFACLASSFTPHT